MHCSRSLNGRALRWLVLAVAATLIVFAWRADSNDARHRNGSQGRPVALLDVAKVYRESKKLQDDLSFIRGGVEELEKKLQEVREAGSAPGSGMSAEELKQTIAKIQRDKAGRQIEMKVQEAQAYAEWYETIQDILREICLERGIGVVFRINSSDVDPDDRAAVLSRINAEVVYATVPDLTDDVLQALKRRGQ